MKCRVCGTEIAPGDSFCVECGTKVSEQAPVADEKPTEQVPMAEVPVVQPLTEDPGKKQGTVSLVFGIISLVLGASLSFACGCLGSMVPIGLAIAGLILGSKGKKASAAAGFENKGAKVGFVLSIVALAVIAVGIFTAAVVSGAAVLMEYM